RLAQNILDTVIKRALNGAGGRGGKVQLPHSRTVPANLAAELTGRQFMRQHLDILEQNTAARCHALAHAVPVVENGDALAIKRNEHADRLLVIADGAEGAEIRKGGAGRIPFTAVQPVTVAIGAEPCGDFAGALGALFGAGTGEK